MAIEVSAERDVLLEEIVDSQIVLYRHIRLCRLVSPKRDYSLREIDRKIVSVKHYRKMVLYRHIRLCSWYGRWHWWYGIRCSWYVLLDWVLHVLAEFSNSSKYAIDSCRIQNDLFGSVGDYNASSHKMIETFHKVRRTLCNSFPALSLVLLTILGTVVSCMLLMILGTVVSCILLTISRHCRVLCATDDLQALSCVVWYGVGIVLAHQKLK